MRRLRRRSSEQLGFQGGLEQEKTMSTSTHLRSTTVQRWKCNGDTFVTPQNSAAHPYAVNWWL
jgi:hypothetical protein